MKNNILKGYSKLICKKNAARKYPISLYLCDTIIWPGLHSCPCSLPLLPSSLSPRPLDRDPRGPCGSLGHGTSPPHPTRDAGSASCFPSSAPWTAPPNFSSLRIPPDYLVTGSRPHVVLFAPGFHQEHAQPCSLQPASSVLGVQNPEGQHVAGHSSRLSA